MFSMYEPGEPCYTPKRTNSYSTARDLREVKAELEQKIKKESWKHDKPQLYLYSYTIPRGTDEQYIEPIIDQVLAEDFEEAEKIIRAKYPEYKVFRCDTCSRRISDTDALKMIFNKR